MTKKQNNNKSYGLGKERELKKKLIPVSMEVVRARGSFGNFDLIQYLPKVCNLISIKSTRADYWSPGSEIKKLRAVKVPKYCKKMLCIYWSPNKNRPLKKGWEFIKVE